jgi:hypothetical protein
MSKELIEIAFYSLNEANLVATAVRAASKSALRVNVFMDSRTAPEELQILRDSRIEYRLAHNEAPSIPEGIYPDMCRQLECEWVWILNVDEWASPELVEAVQEAVQKAPADVQCFGFARRWVRLKSPGQVQYSRLFRMRRGDYQWRVIRHRSVLFEARTPHTPGFRFDAQRAAKLPKPSLLYHFDWIAHSFDVRKRKLDLYEKLHKGPRNYFADYYLPEQREWLHFFKNVNVTEVTALAREMEGISSVRGWADEFQ